MTNFAKNENQNYMYQILYYTIDGVAGRHDVNMKCDNVDSVRSMFFEKHRKEVYLAYKCYEAEVAD